MDPEIKKKLLQERRQIYNRRYAEKNREAHNKRTREYNMKKYREKKEAEGKKVRQYIKLGEPIIS